MTQTSGLRTAACVLSVRESSTSGSRRAVWAAWGRRSGCVQLRRGGARSCVRTGWAQPPAPSDTEPLPRLWQCSSIWRWLLQQQLPLHSRLLRQWERHRHGGGGGSRKYHATLIPTVRIQVAAITADVSVRPHVHWNTSLQPDRLGRSTCVIMIRCQIHAGEPPAAALRARAVASGHYGPGGGGSPPTASTAAAVVDLAWISVLMFIAAASAAALVPTVSCTAVIADVCFRGYMLHVVCF